MKLKPCPFCGGEAEIFHFPENDELELRQHPNWKWQYPNMYSVGCDTSMCFGNRNRATVLFASREQAVEAWNRRFKDATIY
jgi:hypothetical protein